MEIVTALEDWGRVGEAMEQLKFTSEEQDSFWIVLAAITNLGYVAKCLGEFWQVTKDPELKPVIFQNQETL